MVVFPEERMAAIYQEKVELYWKKKAEGGTKPARTQDRIEGLPVDRVKGLSEVQL
jgi:hypothetical protein